MLKFRNEKARDSVSKLANHLYLDHSFPKQSSDYHEISSYLELNGHYVENMSLFDEAWDLYQDDQE